MADAVDFDIHGLARIRLIDAARSDVAVVSRQIGLQPSAVVHQADIVLRFVERLPISPPLYYLGDDVAFTGESFYIVQRNGTKAAHVLMPFEKMGQPCEIICESGAPSVPFLILIINLTLLQKGILPVHASAFRYDGVGVLVAGWANGGKTSALLGFLSDGAEYIGDDWVYASADGRSLYGIPLLVRLSETHLTHMPELGRKIRPRERLRMQSTGLAHSAVERLSRYANNGILNHVPLGTVAAILRRRSFVDVPPQEVFGSQIEEMVTSFDKLFLVVSENTTEVTAEPISPTEVAQRMVFSLQYEYLDFMAMYVKFRFAFPERRNPFLEQLEETQRELLETVFSGKEAYLVRHPYPVRTSQLFEAMRPLVRR
jgi:hypothetical protein